MTTPGIEIDAFVRRARRRWLLSAGLTHASRALGVGTALAALALLLVDSRGIQSAIVAVGVAAIVIGGGAGLLRASRRNTALEIERRAPESHNLVITASELLAAPGTARADVIDFVVRRASATVRALDPAGLFPVGRAVGVFALAAATWLATIAFAARHDPAALLTLGAPAPVDEIGSIRVTVVPPAYTGRPTQRMENPARIDAMAGSRLTLEVRGQDVRVETLEGAISPAGSSSTFVLTAQADGFIAVRAGASARRLIGLTVTPDQVPRVRVTAPGKDMFIADASRKIPVAIDARDDIALTTLKLRYTKVSGSGERFTFVEGEIPVSVQKADDRDWSATGTLDLSSLELEQGDMVVYRGAAADGRPGASLTESDAFIVEITSPLSIAAEGFSVDDQQDKYALSQQMVILKTERLLARASGLSADSLAHYSQDIAAEQRAVRAEFVFMMGGEVAQDVIDAAGLDIDETHEAENESELAAGRMVNRGRVALVEAIRLMSRASTLLNNAEPRDALAEERAALKALQDAFSRTRYLLRALTQRERLDLSRRLTGVLALAARDTRPQPMPPVDAAVASLRRSLAAIAILSSGGGDRSEASRISQQVLAVDPSDTTLQRVALQLGQSRFDEAAFALADALRARLPREDPSIEPADLRRLRGALADAARNGGRR